MTPNTSGEGKSPKFSAAKFRAFFDRLEREAKERGEKRFSYETIAAGIGVSRTAVWEWYEGKSKPKVDPYLALRTFLRATDDDLTEIEAGRESGDGKEVQRAEAQDRPGGS